MRRRGFVKALAALPAAPVILAQQPPQSEELPVLAAAAPDTAAETVTRFFTPDQFAALRKLSDLLMPANGGAGALDAKAPEFLDFLISESPADRQHVYRSGLDALNAQAKKRFSKPFAELDGSQATEFLAPLQQAWTFDDPADPIANFLRAAKHDVRTATVNSREYNGGESGGGRRNASSGLYWLPLD